ncbi:MAG: biotin--[Akkermansia sp.]|nr:biotin--[acetyl-CoA-carboxylase] ligase [Akkermansia sp.]
MSTKWKVVELDVCESTFNVARKEQPWTIVTAERQLKGRGRFNRSWFGEVGGLWATYNLPLAPQANRHWGLLPLVAGVAIIKCLKPYNIKGLRLRWPNDVLVGRDKLAGILVERPSATMASIGIGINMFNDIESFRGKTTDTPTRLADLLYTCPMVGKFSKQLADALAETFNLFVSQGIEALRDDLMAAWGEPLPVVAITDTERYCGHFIGVEGDGSPILRKADGTTITVPGITVNRMKELI